jgi:predicted nucleotidyltransferase
MAITQQQIERAVDVAKAYGATRLILFGSAAENPAEARDLDLACDGVLGWRLYELGGRLEEELQAVVDVVALSPPTPFTRLVERRGKMLV